MQLVLWSKWLAPMTVILPVCGYGELSSRPARSSPNVDMDIPSIRGPYFDRSVSKNVTALVGRNAFLYCRVRNLGNRTVSEFCIVIPTWIFKLFCSLTTELFTKLKRNSDVQHSGFLHPRFIWVVFVFLLKRTSNSKEKYLQNKGPCINLRVEQ